MTDWRDYKRELGEREPSLDRLRIALNWAVCTVHSQVATSEREFERYHYDGILPATLPKMRHRALADIRAFCDALDWEKFRRASLARQLDAIVGRVHGLGYAKVAFAPDFALLHDVACIDIWMARQRLGLPRAPNWKNAKHYLSVVRQAFGKIEGSGREQWAHYQRVNRAFRRSNHAVVFQAMGVRTEQQTAFSFSEVTA